MPHPAPPLVLLSAGSVFAVLFGLTALAAPPPPAGPPPADTSQARRINALLARTVNLGNALEAPTEGLWGVTLEERFFEDVADAGFTAVRLPVKWTAHHGPAPDYRIDPAFFARVDWALDQALSRRLAVVLNVHHFDEIHEDPSTANVARLTALWRQIAARHRDRPDAVVFELLNEPSGELTTARWNGIIPGLLAAVRETNPDRTVMVGPGRWNQIPELKNLRLPPDPNLIVTVHTYEPFEFTHQGAEWVGDDAPPPGRTFPAGDDERTIAAMLDVAADWSKARNRPLFVGEFGAYNKADLDSRVRWTAFMRDQFERRGFSWGYWELAAGFGLYDPATHRWREPLKNALLGG